MFDIQDGVLIKYTGNDKMVRVPENVKVIGEKAFAENEFLTKVILPNKVMAIESNAFFCCINLTIINLPNSITRIEYFAFNLCTALNSIRIPDSVTEIELGSFSGCQKLTEVSLPYELQTIDYGAFSDCFALKTLHVRNGRRTISIALERELDNAYWQELKQFLAENLLSPVDQNPDFVIQDGVLEKYAGSKDVQELTLPEGITKIGDWVFDSCSSLQKLALPASLTEIGTGAFWKCASLREVILPKQMEHIGPHAFGKCTALSELTIPRSLSQIGTDAFLGCNALRSIHVAFADETVTIPSEQPVTNASLAQICEAADAKLAAAEAQRKENAAKEQAIAQAVSRSREEHSAVLEARITALEAALAAQQQLIVQLTERLDALTPPRTVTSFFPLAEEELQRLSENRRQQ